MVRETRHLWVGNLPENIRDEEIVKHFTRYGRVESVKILPKRSAEGGRAAFVDFVDIRSATKAHESVNRIGDREMRTDYNEPGNPGTLSRLHGHTDPPARPRRTEGAPEGRYSGARSQNYYEGFSDDESAAGSRVPSGLGGSSGGGSSNRSRAVSGNTRDHRRQQTYNQEPTRRSSNKPKAYRDQEPSPDHSSGSESGSESSHSGSQSPSTSGSSSSEEGSRDGSVPVAAPPAPVEPPQNTNRSSALCLRNIMARSGDSSVRDGLYHEFKKYGDVVRIYVNGQGSSRYAIIHFRRPEDAERGIEACRGKMFLGAEMDLQYWRDDRYEASDHPPRHRSHVGALMDDEFDPGCTRTLFVGNIEKTTTFADLKDAFERYGEIVDVDIKKQVGNNPYAFIQFVELSSAIQARRRMDREFVGRNRVKVGFGKVSPINTIWVGGLGGLNEQQVDRHFGRYGRVTKVVMNRTKEQALVSFDSVESASIAQGEMKGRSMFGRRVRVEFVSRDSRQLFYDALQRPVPSDNNSRRYEPSSPRSRGRGGASGYYENRWDRSRGGRGNMRRDVSNHRPWHRGEYEYPEGSGYHQRGHARYRGPYEGAGYDSDDYDQELRDYNYSRQREREKEQGRQRHERGGREREREEGNYSGNERFYPENQDRWRDERSSSGSYEDPRERKDTRPREFLDGHDRERGGYSENEERASVHGKPSSHDFEQEEKRSKIKERKKRKPRSPTPEGEPPEEKEALSTLEAASEEKLAGEGKEKKGRAEDGEITEKGKSGGERDWHEARAQGNGSRTERDQPNKEGSDNKVPIPASPPPPVEKGVKRKDKKEKRKKHKRIRASLGEEEEEREQEQESARLEEAAIQAATDSASLSANVQRASVDADLQRLDNRDIHSAPENNRFDRDEFEEKPPRRHSADDRLPKEDRELSRETGSPSPRNKPHRDERRRDWENQESARPKRRRLSNGESPPPPPPPPPPPREAGEALPAHVDVVPRATQPAPDGITTQVHRPSYDVAQAPVRYESQLYDTNRAVSVGLSPVGIPINPAGVAPPNVGTPPLAVHSPGIAIGVPSAPALASPSGMVPPPPPPHSDYSTAPSVPQQANPDTLLDLLRRYPVVWQGLLALKNDSAAVQMHYLAGNGGLAEVSLPQTPTNGVGGSVPPPIRIAQRMRLEPSQLEGVIRRMQSDNDHCLLLALPCGRDPLDVHKQTRALKSGFINYLQQKQAAGIINVARPGSTQPSYVLHIFPPCDFAQEHLARVSPDLLDSAADSGHLMVVVASV